MNHSIRCQLGWHCYCMCNPHVDVVCSWWRKRHRKYTEMISKLKCCDCGKTVYRVEFAPGPFKTFCGDWTWQDYLRINLLGQKPIEIKK